MAYCSINVSKDFIGEYCLTETQKFLIRQFLKENDEVWLLATVFKKEGEIGYSVWSELWTYEDVVRESLDCVLEKETILKKTDDMLITSFKDSSGKRIIRCDLVKRLK